MPGFLIRILIVALRAVACSSEWVPGIDVQGVSTLLGAPPPLGLVNAIKVRPLLILPTLPITVLTLGLFLLVINAGTLALVAWVSGRLHHRRFP